MDSVVASYVEAWNRHDPAALLAAFAPGGSYQDPTTGTALCGPALRRWAERNLVPGTRTRVVGDPLRDGSSVAFEWQRVRAAAPGSPGDAAAEREAGVDGWAVLRLDAGGRIVAARSYFDPGVGAARSGPAAAAPPVDDGRWQFGSSCRAASQPGAPLGAISFTWIEFASDEEQARVRRMSRKVEAGLHGQNGFLGLHAMTVGNREYTVAGWDSPERVAILRRTAHGDALRESFRRGLGRSGFVSTWVPHGPHRLFVRCGECGVYAAASPDAPACRCGAVLELPAHLV